MSTMSFDVEPEACAMLLPSGALSQFVQSSASCKHPHEMSYSQRRFPIPLTLCDCSGCGCQLISCMQQMEVSQLFERFLKSAFMQNYQAMCVNMHHRENGKSLVCAGVSGRHGLTLSARAGDSGTGFFTDEAMQS